MPSFLAETYRRLRFGKPIIVVSGLPRSGTSMTMKMLEAGAIPILTDELRTADESNPKGYYEFEPVKTLHTDPDQRWLTGARGKAVKIISFLLASLPETNTYKVILMHRSLHEVIASQDKMLERRGEPRGEDNERLQVSYTRDLENTERLLAARSCFHVLHVDYRSVLNDATSEAARIRAFVGQRLDVEAMAAVVDQELYRNRHTQGDESPSRTRTPNAPEN